MRQPVTVDTRFFFTRFLAEAGQMKEKTQRKIVELQREKAIVPTIVIHEVYKFHYETLGADIAQLRLDSILRSDFRLVDLTVPIAISAARLRCLYGNLPTADSIVAATALEFKSKTVLSDDPHFSEIKGIYTDWI